MKKSKDRKVASDSVKASSNLANHVEELQEMSDDLRKIPKTGMIVEMPSFMESDEEIPQDQKRNE